MSTTTERGVSRCWQNNGYHVYGAGPCLDSMEEAIDYRERLDYAGTKWVSQNGRWPPKPPADWVNPENEEVPA